MNRTRLTKVLDTIYEIELRVGHMKDNKDAPLQRYMDKIVPSLKDCGYEVQYKPGSTSPGPNIHGHGSLMALDQRQHVAPEKRLPPLVVRWVQTPGGRNHLCRTLEQDLKIVAIMIIATNA